jgi:alpha-L-fucosidase
VAAYQVKIAMAEGWRPIHQGTIIGHKKLGRLADPVTARRVRVTIEDARPLPFLSHVGLYRSPN